MKDIEIKQIESAIAESIAMSQKLAAETENLHRDTKLMPFKVGAGVIVSIVALGYIIIKFNQLFVPAG